MNTSDTGSITYFNRKKAYEYLESNCQNVLATTGNHNIDNSPFLFSILFYVNFWNAIYTHHQILPLYIVNMLTCGLFHTMSAGACLLKYNDLDCGGNSGSVKSLLALRHSAFNFLYLCPLYAIDVPNTIL